MPQPREASSLNTTQPSITPEQLPPSQTSRNTFKQMKPTFAVDLATTTGKLEFLDPNDTARNTIVRKKAREWVNKNKSISKQDKSHQSQSKVKVSALKLKDKDDKKQSKRNQGHQTKGMLDRPGGVGNSSFDPFGIFPDVGRKTGHIIECCEFRITF
jgi:hypothetical protein